MFSPGWDLSQKNFFSDGFFHPSESNSDAINGLPGGRATAILALGKTFKPMFIRNHRSKMGWHVGWRLPEAGSSGWVRWRLHKPYADGEIDRGVFGLVGESWRVVEGYGANWSHFEWFGKEKRVIVHTCAHMCMHECTQVFKWEGANGCRWVVEFSGTQRNTKVEFWGSCKKIGLWWFSQSEKCKVQNSISKSCKKWCALA